MTSNLQTELQIGRDPHAVFKYISIVNKKNSWSVLVLTIPFVANFKQMSYSCTIILVILKLDSSFSYAVYFLSLISILVNVSRTVLGSLYLT